MTRTCLVTGGAGFIGSHLVELLLGEGYRVKVVDNLSCGRIENLATASGNPLFSLIEKDLAEADGLDEIVKDVEWVFHLAGIADIVPSIQRPVDYHRSNVEGTLNLLEASKKAGIQRFVYAASSSCYGIPDSYPTAETAPGRPQYPYALTKYVGEQYCLHWHHVYGLPVVSLRLFNVYGPRSRTTGSYGAVFGVFLAQKLAGRPYTVVGDGTQTRDFTYVTDVARAFLAAADSDVAGEVYNVGSGDTYSVNRLVELLGGEVEYIPKRPGEPDCTFADVGKIHSQLDWKAVVPFEEGVAHMLDAIGLWESAPVWDADGIQDATKEWFACLS